MVRTFVPAPNFRTSSTGEHWQVLRGCHRGTESFWIILLPKLQQELPIFKPSLNYCRCLNLFTKHFCNCYRCLNFRNFLSKPLEQQGIYKHSEVSFWHLATAGPGGMDSRRSDPLRLGGAGDALSVLGSSGDADWLPAFCSLICVWVCSSRAPLRCLWNLYVFSCDYGVLGWGCYLFAQKKLCLLQLFSCFNLGRTPQHRADSHGRGARCLWANYGQFHQMQPASNESSNFSNEGSKEAFPTKTQNLSKPTLTEIGLQPWNSLLKNRYTPGNPHSPLVESWTRRSSPNRKGLAGWHVPSGETVQVMSSSWSWKTAGSTRPRRTTCYVKPRAVPLERQENFA